MNLTKKIYSVLGIALLILSGGCADDPALETDVRGSVDSGLSKVDLQKSLAMPLAISFGSIGNSRAAETKADPDDALFQTGTTADHIIDFDIPNECFALFFNDNGEFMYLKRLFSNDALGSGSNPNDGLGEYVVYAVAYLDKPEDWEFKKTVDDFKTDGKTEEQALADYEAERAAHETAQREKLPSKLLVVLNGGRIYSKLVSEYNINEDTGEPVAGSATVTTDDILDFKWDYLVDNTGTDMASRLQVIGVNIDGHYTMTNSAYYGPDEDPAAAISNPGYKPEIYPGSIDPSAYTLQTVRPIDRTKIMDATAINIKQENCAAKVYLERMVARFSAPKFPTEVIGSNKVFRPSQDARPVVIYSFRNGLWRSEETNWLIHVLGWTINGREKENYLFKHIRDGWEGKLSGSRRPGYKTDGYVKDWNSSDWNDPAYRRSYWSIDPHYDYDPNNETQGYQGDYYPWQYRGALDKSYISWLPEESHNIALRYLTFDEVRYWDDNAITISENTFNPYYGENYIINSSDYLDTRASMLMGPHLLVTAELLLGTDKSSDNDYQNDYSKVTDLYGDRYFRYFRSDVDLFRMFVKDINDALRTQATMSFKYYEWKENSPGNNNPPSYTAVPVGHVQLYFDLELGDAFVNALTHEEQVVYKQLLDHKDDFHGKPVAEVIEKLQQYNIKLTIEAPVKDGDARVLPWVPGIVFRQTGNFKNILEVSNGSTTFNTWTDDMRKSLIFEWFGPVDHYKNGYMYYAADIPHHVDSNGHTYYGAVRNHWYTFTVKAINSLGTPVGNASQRIIPGKYKYQDQMSVYVEPLKWHFIGEVSVGFN